jgi:hypothetical protein
LADLIKMSIRFVTVGEMSLPNWMTSYAQQIFGIPTHMTALERLMLLQTGFDLPERFTAVEIGSYLGASTAFPRRCGSATGWNRSCGRYVDERRDGRRGELGYVE